MAEARPIYVVFGTRAQLIKMAPVMRELLRRDTPYTLVHTGQHREYIRDSLSGFNLPPPDINLERGDREAETRGGFARWLVRMAARMCLGARSLIPRPGVMLVHGDTVSTVLGALLGKLSGCTVVHVEAGLRSFDIWNPFPEELCRLAVFHLAHHYLCPDDEAAANLSGYGGRKVVLGGNTLYDSVQFALERQGGARDFSRPYAVASIHRYENVFDRRRFEDVILPRLREMSRRVPLIFVLHPVTRAALVRYGLWEGMEAAEDIRLCERMGYVDFIHLIRDAEFVVTDGGSNQEELSYLGVPCLLLRKTTERGEGLGANVVLSGLQKSEVHRFLQDYQSFATSGSEPAVSPSRRAVDFIMHLAVGRPRGRE